MPTFHHYVPRFYLAHFADGSMIQRVDLRYRSSSAKSIKKVGGLDDFYTIPHDDPQIVEKNLFGKLETKTAPIFKRIIDDDEWPLPAEDRASVAEYLAIQFLRGDDQRYEQSELASLLLRIKLAAQGKDSLKARAFDHDPECSEEQLEAFWKMLVETSGQKITATSSGHLDFLTKSFDKVVPYFGRRPWALVRFTRKTLLTCDAPVSLIPHPEHDRHAGVGLRTAMCIVFPLSRRVGILLGDATPLAKQGVNPQDIEVGSFDIRKPGSVQIAGEFNHATIENAHVYIFHHPEDGSLLPAELPPPQLGGIEAVGAEELIQELIAQGGLAVPGGAQPGAEEPDPAEG